MENASSNNEASSGTSALDDGLERIYKAAMHDMQVIKARITELQNGVEPDLWQFASSVIFSSLWKAAIYEREACEKACWDQASTPNDSVNQTLYNMGVEKCAKAIRERSNVEHNRRPQGVRVDGPVGPHVQEK